MGWLALVTVVVAGCGRPSKTMVTSDLPLKSPLATSPNDPVVGGSAIIDPGANAPGSASRVEITANAVNLRPRHFESAAVVGDRSVAIRFYSGVAPCEVLGRVDVIEADAIEVTLFSGQAPGSADVACIELAVFNEVLVTTQSPVAGRPIVDGAQ